MTTQNEVTSGTKPFTGIIVRHMMYGVQVQGPNTGRPVFIPRSAFGDSIYEGFQPGVALEVVISFDGNSRWNGSVNLAPFTSLTDMEKFEELRRLVALNNARQIKAHLESYQHDLTVTIDEDGYDPKTGYPLSAARGNEPAKSVSVSAEIYTVEMADNIFISLF